MHAGGGQAAALGQGSLEGNVETITPEGFSYVLVPSAFGTLSVVWRGAEAGPQVYRVFLPGERTPVHEVVQTAFPGADQRSCPAIAGLAVGIVSGHDVGEAVGKGAALGAASGAIIGGTKSYMEGGEKIREDLYNMNMKNQAVLPNEIAYGYLFFPATPGEEAVGAEELRLSLTWGNTREIVKLNLRNQ